MPEKKRRGPVLFLRGLSKSVKNLFKSKVVRRELTMTDVVEALMSFYMDNAAMVEPYVQKVLDDRKRAKRKS